VLQLAEAGRSGGVEAGAGLVQLALEPQRLVVQHRELGLQAAVLRTVLDHALRPAQQLRLHGGSCLVVLVFFPPDFFQAH
jgi:hypothetical protein